jgi:hypothetical protein
MTAAMERMLEKKFSLTKPIARAVAKEARDTLGIGKTLIWSATYERECLRIMKKNGVATKNDAQEMHFTWIPIEPKSSLKVDKRLQTSHFNLSPSSKTLDSPRKIVPMTMEQNSPKKEMSRATPLTTGSDPFSSCMSPRSMKMVPSSSMKKATDSLAKTRQESPLKMQSSVKMQQPSSHLKRVASLGKMQTASQVKESGDCMLQSPNQDKRHRAASSVTKPDDALRSKVKTRSKKTQKETKDSGQKSAKVRKSDKKTRNNGHKANHHESIETESSPTCSPTTNASGHSFRQSPNSQESPTTSMKISDYLPPPPLVKQEIIKKKSQHSSVSESGTRRDSRRDESYTKLCQADVTPTRSRLYGSLSSTASPLRWRIPGSEEQSRPANSETETTLRAGTSKNNLDDSSNVLQLTARFETEGQRTKRQINMHGRDAVNSRSPQVSCPRAVSSSRRQVVCV